jgi:F0F1-type ATP synthase assembly protein I
MELFKKNPVASAAVAFVLGLIIGLVVLGWWLFPVEYTGTTPAGLVPDYQAIYVRSVAELFSFDNNQDKVRAALGGWGGDAAACQLAAASTDPADQQRLIAAATVVNGTGCTGAVAPVPGATVPGATVPDAGAETGGIDWLPVVLGLLLLGLLAGILWILARRRNMSAEPSVTTTAPDYSTMPETIPAATTAAAAAAAAYEPVAVPIARFRTNYTRGHDAYDDSFSIENAGGEFLGECGVGISEVIGAGTPKNVTAFEVWLFDKNDIRTITKVIMSDHAFFDEAVKAKLAPKGEPVLARPNETIVLETASLIINAEITDLGYLAGGELPSQSTFDQFTIELSAWAKEGDYNAQGTAGEDMLAY